ncbi:Rhs element Vgr protein [Oceanospirillum multiglobuliferum]|uniref:Gp5/Type VI secretion system Vgr protein OB-fold domain-containing protein n=2 Tax=Oceanospirillum TaxID=965 RepID=A0A1T4MSD8_9GAMM|nr:type VI secretion system tip protein TssI/VgrG [Oceanospirillum multiglobuliferum]OPX56907.1 hypothetical protein BTE48_00270 [Oceanospirillum multiglobuliferum]SJZ69912.1 Rhs element Vgr protein [Oceanospirillum multiglobuliferum]
MSLSPDVKFEFINQGVDENCFQVLQFIGTESLGDLFQFEIKLISQNQQLDVDAILNSDSKLILDVYGKLRVINGILSDFKYLGAVDNGHIFQATLVPKLWLLSQIITNEVYLALDINATLIQLFDESSLTESQYDLSGLTGYRKWDYRCQFGESHYDFLKRITEREGIYYFFDSNDNDKLIFCDSTAQYSAKTTSISYNLLSGLSLAVDSPIVYQWTRHNQRIAKKITIKDYNNDQPSVDLSASYVMNSSGVGEVFRYCDHLIDKEEAERLVEIRAQELLLKKEQFFGSSIDVGMSPAHLFELVDHPFQALNQRYNPIQVCHQGYSPALKYLHGSDELPYSNTLTAINADIEFRPEQKTEKPRFYGVLNAIIDSEGDGQYAHLDSRGRYRVSLPFDRRDRDGAQASWWVPMSQPNAGEGSGMHFPLLKGTEVLLSFIGGDPDRPVITGAVPNAAKPSIVSEENHTANKIKTAAGNVLEMQDEAGSNRIKLFSPHNNSYLHLGAANPVKADGITMMTNGGWYQEIAGGYQITRLTKKNQDAVRDQKSVINGKDIVVDIINESDVFPFPKADDNGKLTGTLSAADERSGNYFTHREHGEKYFWNDENIYTFGGAKNFNYGNGYEVSYVDYESNSTWDGSFGLDHYSVPGSDPSKMLVSKTIGHTYDYQHGNKEEVYLGLDAISRESLLAKTEASICGVTTTASISVLNFSFEAGIKFGVTLAASVDMTFGPQISRSDSSQDIFGFTDVAVSSANKVGLYVAPQPPDNVSTNWEVMQRMATGLLTSLGLKKQALQAAATAGSVFELTQTPPAAKLSVLGANSILVSASGITGTTTAAVNLTGGTTNLTATTASSIKGATIALTATTSSTISAPSVSASATGALMLKGGASAMVDGGPALTLKGAALTVKADGIGNINAGGMLKVSAAGLVQLG